MRIGVNARTFSVEQPGGAVQSARRLTREFISLANHEVILFGPSSIENEFDAEVRSDGFVKAQSAGLIWERTLLPRLATATDVDVLYCPNGNAPLHDIRTPVVMCVHDVNAQKGWSGGIHQFYRRITVPLAARACNTLVTVSEFSKREITNSLGVDSSKVSVIYNGVNDIYFDGESKPIDLPEQYLLFVGSLNPRKNLKGVLEAFKRVRATRDIQLVLVGPDNKGIFKNIDVNSEDSVVRCGYLEAAEVKYAYENAEAFVFPSFYEGFGLPPLEALACGTPVVASDRGSLPEVLNDAATYVNPESPADIARGIQDVLDGGGPCPEDMHKTARKYTWNSVADKALTVFEKVI